MGGHKQKRIIWYDVYSVDRILIDDQNSKESNVFVLDIAGCGGYDLSSCAKRYPDVPGRLILQDVPDVINNLENSHEDVKRMIYNVVTLQPMEGG